jgi:choline dehydrogenase-like flavoprotein
VKTKQANTYDAIVIGSGISGGWAAKELCEKGLKTLVLERGKMVKHIEDYPTAMLNPWDFKHRNQIPVAIKDKNPILSRCYAFDEATQHFFVKDEEHPYVQEKPFDWIRGYQVGGKSLLWARQTQRWSSFDFEGPTRDGFGVDWPIRYEDLAPWYSYVEKFAGISGNKDGLPAVPDGEFLPPFDLNCVEKHFQESIAKHYNDRKLIIGRAAHLTNPQPWHTELGRGMCQTRHLCYRGCPYGAYFSSNAATLPAAERTKNLTIRPASVVHSIIYDETKKKAVGVRVIDANTNETVEYFAKIIFLNASTVNSTLILLNSTSNRFPNGLGNDSGELGHNLMCHIYRGRVFGTHEGFKDRYYSSGRRPTSAYMPRFRNLYKQETDFLRGYACSIEASRPRGQQSMETFGADFKEKLTQPGDWQMSFLGMGEHLPNHANKITRSKEKKDAWGIPQVVMNCEYGENEERMIKDMHIQGSEMLEKAGFKNIQTIDTQQAPGLDIHEMGTARMGKNPKTSVLNKWNQVWDCENVFVTDGSCMTSSSTQNPSLTYMAITARAANYAVSELNKKNL